MTKQEWKLLKEIREVKQLDPSDQSKYWNNKFEKATSEEDSNLRERFKSLEKNNYINVFWADNIPYTLTLTDKGQSYNYFREHLKSSVTAIIKWIFSILSN
ncbi:MAG: hypothetical protein WBI36_07680 [Erysipelotrichaceae bacterium]|uniref:hypothetical protein n=1 Tax=Gallicola sp. Sow4_E12 TaxID=3438785 RepID=UPI003CA8D132